jgi:succinyl-diaminopimelate desuccinylase
VRLIIGTKEETGDWSDIEFYLKQRGAPDYSYTPDAEFPLITGEKGMINLDFIAKWPPVAPNAETGMQFIELRGGERSNIVPALAECVLRFPSQSRTEVMKELVRETTRFTVENPGSNVTLLPNNDKESAADGTYEALVSFVGKAAHSSLPDKGHNALADALKFFSDIETLPPPVRAFIQFLAFAAATPDGSNLQLDSTHPFVGATTAVLTLSNIGPTGGSGMLNVRPTMGLTCDTVLEQARAAAAAFADTTGLEIEVSVRGGRTLDAIYLDPDKPGIGDFLAALRGGFEAVTGQPGTPMAIGGTTYAKAIPNCCAFGPCLPGTDEELAHQADEHLAVDSIRRNTLIYGLSLALMG